MYEDFQRSYKEIRTEFAEAHKELSAAFASLKTEHAVQARDREYAVESYKEERTRQSAAIAECKQATERLTKEMAELRVHVDERFDRFEDSLRETIAPFAASSKRRVEFWTPIKTGGIVVAIGAILATTVGPLLAGLWEAIKHGMGGP